MSRAAEIDAALETLRDLARREGLYSVDVYVRADGRVDVYGTNSSARQSWILRGDLTPGGADPSPGVAVAARLSLPSSNPSTKKDT